MDPDGLKTWAEEAGEYWKQTVDSILHTGKDIPYTRSSSFLSQFSQGVPNFALESVSSALKVPGVLLGVGVKQAETYQGYSSDLSATSPTALTWWDRIWRSFEDGCELASVLPQGKLVSTASKLKIIINLLPQKPRNLKLANSKHQITEIPFDKDGYPVFSGVMKVEVKIRMTGHHRTDYARANAAAGYSETPLGFT